MVQYLAAPNSSLSQLNKRFYALQIGKTKNNTMTSPDQKSREIEIQSLPSSSDYWKERIVFPTLIAGFVGGVIGLFSKHRKVHGVGNISATYATNLAIVAGCYCGAREFVRTTRQSEPDDLLNSAIAGFGTGALLGRFQGGQAGAIRYSVIFTVVGTTVDYATLKLKPILRSYREKSGDWLKVPEWSPIKVLDEEALKEKQAREKKLYERQVLGKLNKEESRMLFEFYIRKSALYIFFLWLLSHGWIFQNPSLGSFSHS